MAGLPAPMLGDSVLPTDEDGNPIITLDGEEDTEKTLPPYDPLAPNLVTAFKTSAEGLEELREIAEEVIKNFDTDWDGSSKYREWIKKTNMLFSGELPPKEFPWEGCANAHVPILLENITRITARVESELFGDWSNICSVPSMGTMFQDEAELLQIHSNWQIREQIPDFPRQMSRGLQNFIMVGDVTCHSYYDEETWLNRHEILTADDFVTPYSHTSVMPDYGDCHHYTKVLRYYRHQLQAYRGKWEFIDEVLDDMPAWDDEPDAPVREGQAEVAGEEMPSDVSGEAPYTLLHYEGWMELPLQERDRWVQVVVDRKTKNVLCLKIHEEADWQDKARFEAQQQEMQQYQQAQEQYGQMMAQYQAQVAQVQGHADQISQAHDSGEMPPEHARAAIPHLQQMIPPPPPPPPPPPQWVENPEDMAAGPRPPRMIPIRMFSHGVCFEPMTGSLGLGLGRPLADYNRAANVALSQFTDAATLGNAKGFIVADTVDFERPFNWAPGKINKAKGVTGIELKNAILPIDPGAANPQLLQLVQLMQANGQAAAQAPDVLSGEPGKSGETYRGIATRIEQATKQLTVVGRRFANFVKQVLKNNARLNAVFLREEELFLATQDATRTMRPLKVNKELYQRGYKFEIKADMTFAGKAERIAESDQIAQMWTAFPPLQQPGGAPFLQLALKHCLEARGQREFVPYLGPIPPPPPTPFGLPPPGMMGAPPPGGAPPQGQPGGNPASGEKPPEPPAAANPHPNAPTGPGGPISAPPPNAPKAA